MAPLTRVTLVDSLIAQLRQQILSGRLSPGQPLPSEREIREAFGVGRTTVREALQGMVAAGFVERRNRQLVVADPRELPGQELDYGTLATQFSVEDVYETRKLLECRIVEVAARNWVEDDLEPIREALTTMHAAEDEEQFHTADMAFHTSIARVTKRPALVQVYESNLHLFFRLPTFWRVFGQSEKAGGRHVGSGWAGHARVFDAIEARDADAAVRTTFDLLDTVQRDLVERVALARHSERAAAVTSDSPSDEAAEFDPQPSA